MTAPVPQLCRLISQLFDQNVSMFNFCVCSSSRKADINPKSKHYAEVQSTLSQDEQVMLELIYNDLAKRNHDSLLTFENFLLFFGLTGLWGAKLFRQFDEDTRKLITKEEFFYGLSRTAKAPYSQKVKQLFNFFKDEEDNGIKFIDFTKMLYNYSRDELKQILMEDKYMIPELNRTISQNLSSTEPEHSSSSLVSVRYKPMNRKETVIELNYEEPKPQDQTCFGKTYAQFSQYRDPGTILELKFNDLTYKVNYCNMITLVKQFTKKIYKNYKIDIKSGIFTFVQFSQWIQSHTKLFQTYYTSFHTDIWSYCDSEPNFLGKIERSFTAKMSSYNKVKSIYGMLIEDVLIISESYKSRRNPFRIVCLEGLIINQVSDTIGFGVQISHRDEYYQKFVLYFKSKEEALSYLQNFRLYEGDTLHDLYNSHEMIGTGKFSTVYRCTSKQTGKSFALKDISTEKLTSQAISTLDNESEIMKVITHPQIVKYQQTIRSKAHIYIIAEYIYGKDLDEYVRKRKKLSEYISAFIIGKVIEATIYLHSLEIIHRDLKPENIMVMLKQRNSQTSVANLEQLSDEEAIENIKIIDFGLANHLSQIEKSTEKHSIAGTPNYMAPEVILGNRPTPKTDIFAIGSILYFLLSGKLAFAYQNMEYTLLRSVRGEYDLKDGVWKQISPQAKDLISRLLQIDPDKRIGLQQALNHRWFQIVTNKKQQKSEASDTTEPKKEEGNCKLESLSEVDVEAIVQCELQKKQKKSRL